MNQPIVVELKDVKGQIMRTLLTGVVGAAAIFVGVSAAQAAPVGQLVTGYTSNAAKVTEQVNWRRHHWYPRHFFFRRHWHGGRW